MNKTEDREEIDVIEKSPNALRTIGEAAELIGVPTYVLRFWETKFDQIQPIKNKGRRYYEIKDIDTLKEIKSLLYTQGFTIKGVQNHLVSKGQQAKMQKELPLIKDLISSINSKESATNLTPNQIDLLKGTLSQLLAVEDKLKTIINNKELPVT